MSNEKQSTPSRPTLAGWTESYGFRETFLQHFTQPGHATALTLISIMLHDYALESARHWPAPAESTTRREIRYGAADLKWLAAYFTSIGLEWQQSSLGPEDETLSKLAGRVAGEVGRLAAMLEGAVGEERLG